MNEEDRRMQRDERDAEPERFPAERIVGEEVESPTSPVEKEEMQTRRSTDSSRTSTESLNQRGISRMSTQRDDVHLDRHPTSLSRIATGRSQQSHTVAANVRSRTSLKHSKTSLPNFGGGKPFPPPLPDREEYVVEFDGPSDPIHAQNWPLKKKIPIAVALGFLTLTAAFGSSIFSAVIGSVALHFGVSSEVGILGVSLYVLGFATGPIAWAPFSELYGRRIPLILSAFGMGVFNIGL